MIPGTPRCPEESEPPPAAVRLFPGLAPYDRARRRTVSSVRCALGGRARLDSCPPRSSPVATNPHLHGYPEDARTRIRLALAVAGWTAVCCSPSLTAARCGQPRSPNGSLYLPSGRLPPIRLHDPMLWHPSITVTMDTYTTVPPGVALAAAEAAAKIIPRTASRPLGLACAGKCRDVQKFY